MAEPDAAAQSPGDMPRPMVEKGADAAPLPTTDEFFSSPDLPDADAFFSEEGQDATQTLNRLAARGSFPAQLARPFLPETNEGWSEWLSSTPAGRIGSAFGDAFTGGGFSQAWDEGVVEQMRKWGVFNPAKEAHEANSAAYGFGIVRPALTSLRAFNEHLTRGLLDLPVVTMDILARTGEGLGAAIAKAGEEAETDSLGRALQTGAFGRDVAGMIELAMTRGEISPPLPHPVARGRANAVIGERGGDAAYFGLREPSQAEQRARMLAADDLPDPTRAPFLADAADWGSRRLAALEAKASAGGQAEVWDLLSPAEQAEYRFLRQYGRDGEMVLRGYPALEGHLRERYQPPAEKPGAAGPQGAAGAPPAEAAPPGPTEPVDAPTLARHLKPDLFRQWDNLEARRRDYFRWLDELADVRDRNREATPSPEVAALDNKISDLERKVANAGARSRPRMEADLAAARAEREGVLDAQTADSPDMAQVRRRLVENDLRMRDMAVDVSAALREAEAMLPAAEEAAPVSRETAPQTPVVGVEPKVPEAAPAVQPELGKAERDLPAEPKEPVVSEEQRQAIYDDVYQRLVAAGRPVEQAIAEAQLWAEHILARAERMGGALGSARQIHERETPTFRLGQSRETPRRAARARELAQPAFHGSPFVFDKFTLDHLGKGEGAQAYGHGLYFASNKAVAKYYREQLSARQRLVKITGTTQPIYTVAIEIAARSALKKGVPTVEGTAAELRAMSHLEQWTAKNAQEMLDRGEKPAGFKTEHQGREFVKDRAAKAAVYDRLAGEIDRGEIQVDINPYAAGRLYHVELAPEPHEWLDWDKSLGEQSSHLGQALESSPEVQGMLREQARNAGIGPDEDASHFINGFLARGSVEILYRRLSEFLKSPAAASEALHKAGVRGIRYLDQISRGKGTGSHNFVVFDPGDVTIKEFEQARRGSVTFQPGNLRPLIKLFADADSSTVMHESSHVWLEELLRDAAHERAPAQVKADAETIQKWLKIKPGKAVGRGAHEKFARGFERYLMEGVAPSRALVGIFEQFKAWLTAIYQRLTSLRSPINDDVRAVFDRMLSAAPERAVIAGEMKAREGLGDAHAAIDTATRRGPGAFPAARRVRAEANAEIINHHPEIADDLGLGGGTETPGGGAGPGAVPDGGGAPAGALPGEGGGLPAARAVGAGGGEFAPEGPSPRPAGARESGLYAKVPKQPRRLTELIKQHGGISDGGAALENVLAAGRRGKGVARPGGMTMERMAEMAKDEGYFPELGDRLPDPDELLAKLREDQQGTPQYSDFDRDEIAAYDAAMGQNAEVDRIASEYGVEVRKRMTQREFWDTVAERLSEEQAAKLAEEIDDSRAALVEEAERRAQEYIESRGEAWEPDLFFDRAEPRTLEDLENEHAAEQGLGGQGGRAGGPAEAGRAGGVASAVPSDSGQSQRFVGSAGRGGSEGGAPTVSAPRREPGAVDPTDANARFADPEPELIDKAGNIRLDNLNAPEDVNAVLRAIAAEHDDFIGARRGVVSDTARMAYADTLGVSADVADKNIEALRALSVNDPYPLAARIEAARRLLIQSAIEVRDTAAAAAAGDDAALMAYTAARQRHINIQETLSGATAEWGRAGRAFHRLSGDKGASDAQMMTELFQSAVGRSPEQLRAEAQMVMALETPGAISNFMQAVKQPSFPQMAVEFLQGSALWNPKTWTANGAGSVLTFLTSAVVHPVTVGIGKVRSLVTGSQERAFAEEILPRLFGAIEGAKNGFRAARAVMKDEAFLDRSHSRSEFGFDFGEDARRRDVGSRRNLPGKFGVGMRYSFRIMGATDVVFKGIGYQQKLAELAAHRAVVEGLEGTALQARITNLMQSPTAEMRVEAKKYADYQTFNQDLQGLSRKFQNLAGEFPIIKLMGPLFIRTPINILKYSAEHSILAPLLKEARANLSGARGAIARDEALAKIAVGTAVSTATLAYVSDGTITGGGPKDPRERAILMATGWRPYSIRINGEYVPYSRLEPISTLIGVAADAAEIWHQMTDRDSESVGMMIWGSVTQNLLNKQYMGGLSDFFEVMNDPVRYGENWAGRLMTGLVPSGLRHLGLAYNDPYLREASGIIDRVRSNVGIGTDLPVRRDIFGEPIRRDEAFGPDFASPFTESPVNNDPVLREMQRLEFFPSRPSKKIAGVDLTPQQYDDFCRIGGREAKARLDALLAEPGWPSIPGADRREIMRQTFQEARETARAQVIMESMGTDNDIEAKASQLKEDLTRRYNEAE